MMSFPLNNSAGKHLGGAVGSAPITSGGTWKNGWFPHQVAKLGHLISARSHEKNPLSLVISLQRPILRPCECTSPPPPKKKMISVSTRVLFSFILICCWRWHRGKHTYKGRVSSEVCVEPSPWLLYLYNNCKKWRMCALCIFPAGTLHPYEQKKLRFPLPLHRETFKANICLGSVADNDYRRSRWGY